MTEKERKELYKKFGIEEEAPSYFSEETEEKIKTNLKNTKLGKPVKFEPEQLIEEFFKYVKTLTKRELIFERNEDGVVIDIKEKFTNLHATKVGFSVFLGVGKRYLYEVEESITYDYSDTLKTINDLMEEYNATIIDMKDYTKPYDIFFMKNVHHWTDRIETKNENNNTNTTVNKVLGKEPTE